MQVRKQIKKLGAVVGTGLMVGMTMGSAATLAEFPNPFVTEDGAVSSQVVVGSGAKVADVVGAVNIAAALGQRAVETESHARMVSGFGWNAVNGETLDTRNDDLYFGNNIDAVRQTLTASSLDVLQDTTFQDDAGTSTDIEYVLNIGSQVIQFTKPETDQDPVLNVNNPSSVNASNYLYHMQANFEDEINFTDADVSGQEIELFGKTYTVSADSTTSDLVLLGSREEISLETGESGTLTVNGNEHSIEVVAVTSSSTAAFRVDGELNQKDEEQSFNLDGESVRVENVIQTDTQTSSGLVTFAVGSEEITIAAAGDAVQDGDGNDIDGTYASLQGADAGAASGIDVYVGTDDDDADWVAAGHSWSHPLFEQVAFHFGGLNPDTSVTGDAVESVRVTATGDSSVAVDFLPEGESDTKSVAFSYTNDDGATLQLADGDGNSLRLVEGEPLAENEYTILNAGNEDDTDDKGRQSRLVQVMNIDDDEVTLKDQLSGDTINIDLDSGDGEGTVTDAVGSEVIGGYTYHVLGTDLETTSPKVNVTWGDGAGTTENTGSSDDDTITEGSKTSAYMTLETQNGLEITFLDDSISAGGGLSDGDSLVSFTADEQFIDAGSAQSSEGNNGYGDGDDIVRDDGGSGTYSTAADTVVNDEGTADRSDGDALVSVGTSARYYDADSSTTYNTGDEVYLDDDGDTVYTAQPDTVHNGTAPSAGTSLTTSAIAAWTKIGVIDAADGGAWDAGADTIFYDVADDDFFNATNSEDFVIAGATPGSNTTQTGEGGKDGDWTTINLFNNAADSGAYDHTVDAIIEDPHNGGTYSAAADTAVSRGSDTVIDVTDGTSLTDLDETTYLAVDTGGDGFDAGTDDDIVTDDDSDNVYTAQADTLIVDGSDVTQSAGDSLTAFAATTKHDESVTSNSQYDATENIAIDSNTNNQFDSGETVLLGGSSATEQHPAVTDYINTNGKPSDPTVLFIAEEASDDTTYTYAVGTSGNTGQDRIDISSPTFSDSTERETAALESNSDITAGYDVFGIYTEYDTADEGAFTLRYPQGQAVAGAAFTDNSGSLAQGGNVIQYETFRKKTALPDVAALDSEVTESVRSNNHLVLVGGPAVNTLVSTLQDNGDVSFQELIDAQSGAVLQVVDDAFASGQHALVVAGYGADDTRAAARYVANYADHEADLANADSRTVLTEADLS